MMILLHSLFLINAVVLWLNEPSNHVGAVLMRAHDRSTSAVSADW